MELRFGFNGTDKKRLAAAIGEITGTRPVYQKAPSFAYVISDFTVEKDSTLTFDDSKVKSRDSAHLFARLRERGFIPAHDGGNVLSIGVPLAGFTETALGNITKKARREMRLKFPTNPVWRYSLRQW